MEPEIMTVANVTKARAKVTLKLAVGEPNHGTMPKRFSPNTNIKTVHKSGTK
jgi:hypothetical protein